MNTEHEQVQWKMLHETDFEETDMLKVPGGYLIRTKFWNAADQNYGCVAMIFVKEED